MCFCILLAVLVGALAADKWKLRNSLVRFHVVANSDSRSDQEVKLLVRDAVIESIQKDLSSVADVGQAKQYLQENLPKIETIANSVLKAAGFEERAVVSLCKEAFSQRTYDTFTLPSGVYDALRIVIGAGEGENWWCVTFPSLCIPATCQDFVETAADTGIPVRIANSLANNQEREIHFYLLDAIGKVENAFFRH